MKTVTRIAELRAWRREQTGSLGLVPTMGYLHAGHLSLVSAARHENERVAATLFVNPTQFGPTEDFASYPRDQARDEALLAAAGCDLLFAPAVSEMYPAGVETTVDVGSVAVPLEGERRPGHFRGVATVVMKLLQIATPDRAYFGEKDAQQLAVIRRFVADLDVPVEVRGCPIVREADGLAMSSRNTYLSPDERRAATVLVRALDAAEARWSAGERLGGSLQRAMVEVLDREPLARTDYAVAADPDTFRPVDRATRPGAPAARRLHRQDAPDRQPAARLGTPARPVRLRAFVRRRCRRQPFEARSRRGAMGARLSHTPGGLAGRLRERSVLARRRLALRDLKLEVAGLRLLDVRGAGLVVEPALAGGHRVRAAHAAPRAGAEGSGRSPNLDTRGSPPQPCRRSSPPHCHSLAPSVPQVSYFTESERTTLVRPEGLEPPTPRFEAWCSIQLSYGRTRPDDTAAGAGSPRPSVTRSGSAGACSRPRPGGRRRPSPRPGSPAGRTSPSGRRETAAAGRRA